MHDLVLSCGIRACFIFTQLHVVGSYLLDKFWFELKWIYYDFGSRLSVFVLIIVISLVNGLFLLLQSVCNFLKNKKKVIRVEARL